MLALAVLRFNMSPRDFWQLTFSEWFPIYNAAIGRERPMSKAELLNLEEQWANGNTRRTDSKN